MSPRLLNRCLHLGTVIHGWIMWWEVEKPSPHAEGFLAHLSPLDWQHPIFNQDRTVPEFPLGQNYARLRIAPSNSLGV